MGWSDVDDKLVKTLDHVDDAARQAQVTLGAIVELIQPYHEIGVIVRDLLLKIRTALEAKP